MVWGSDLMVSTSSAPVTAISIQFGFNLDLDAEPEQGRVSWLAFAEMCNR